MTSTLIAECPICKGDEFVFEKDSGGNLFAKECVCAIEKRIERYLHSSGVDYEEYQEKSLEKFLPDNDESAKMKSTAQEFLSDPAALGIGYFGKSGTGKTHICIAICQEMTKTRHTAHLYFSYRKEIQKLKGVAYNAEEYEKQTARWTQCPILYIDDLFKFATGRDGNIQSQDLQIMYDIINTRYINHKITIFSSEYALKEIIQIDSALGGRIYEMCNPYLMKCTEKSRRFK